MSEMKKGLQRRGARKGFTLVELLIVIIIIGILAGAMMLVAGSSRDTAEASKIISDLRSVKAAAVMWMTESPSSIKDTNWTALTNDPTPLNKYLDRALMKGNHNFVFVTAKLVTQKADTTSGAQEHSTTAWLLGYKLDGARDGVKNALAKQAQSAGLYGGNATVGEVITIDMTNPGTTDYYNAGQNVVYVIVQ